MPNHMWVLDDEGKPVPATDTIAWAKWFQTANRVVAQTHVKNILVSTVFLAIDHNFGCGGAPILWETMIFGGEHSNFQQRYTSKEDALKGHRKAVALVRGMRVVNQ